MLQVVEHQDHGSFGEVGDQGLAPGTLRSVQQYDPMGDGARERRRVGDRGERDEPRAVREARRNNAGDLDREAGLADAARTGQRHEACVLDQSRDIRHLRVGAR